MFLLDNWHKCVLAALLVAGYSIGSSVYFGRGQVEKTERAVRQLDDDSGEFAQQARERASVENNVYALGWVAVAVGVVAVFAGDLVRLTKGKGPAVLALAAVTGLTGCGRRPFEPVKLEVISSTEEAFLIPYTGDARVQSSTNKEQYLKENLVLTKQVQIPQQWVPKGYETWGANGEWQDAALLIKVDTSPVSREWTADPNSGTSNRNEAIWVMTSDQVEFSTGWTCTARIASRDDAVRFLYNYPNGSLVKVLDSEVRGKLQAVFGLEVTDLPMDTLRKAATPHILSTVKHVTEFFKERGITITNLGISGGFVYKDKTILDTMVKVFNAEQEKAIAAAESAAQEERNKKVIFEATGKADALLKTKKAEADGIKLVADAKMYELQQAADRLPAYVSLKQLELQRDLLVKWDGSYPRYFLGGAGGGPNLLLQLPPVDAGHADKK
jgi:hypothetical protein